MFEKILVANRGEIALRVIRACKEMGIATVAVYSEADAEALPVKFADEAVCIGPPPARQSYLNIPRIIGAAEITNADAIHPGYGFLAENAQFAEICRDLNLTFIGPSPETISSMGDKALARNTMSAAGVPVLPGSDAVLKNEDDALGQAAKIGYPVILKATAGGGGKGMRIVNSPAEMGRNYSLAHAEAETAFGNGAIYLEKFLEKSRHIEIQVMGYADGTVQAFGERDCSIQRRHQKLIEECPSPIITAELRWQLTTASINGSQAVNYLGAGTIEYLVSGREFFFMEMNTRIQVEHPITEMVSGVDLVKEQIRAVAGEPPSTNENRMVGHAIECRINAEDPERGFTPSAGQITSFHPPGGMGIRLDTHAFAGYKIPPFYDSLIAKLIAYGRDRDEALRRALRALDEFIIEGVKTTIPLHQRILVDPKFVSGEYHTKFLEEFLNGGNNEH